MEKLCVHDAVADSGVDERREISEGVIEMVRLVPGRVSDAEPFLFVARWSCQVDGGAVIQGLVRVIPPQIREETADANSRSSARVIVLDGCGGAHKIEWNAQVHTEVARKVVSESGAEIVDAAVAAVASFELAA